MPHCLALGKTAQFAVVANVKNKQRKKVEKKKWIKNRRKKMYLQWDNGNDTSDWSINNKKQNK